MGLYDQMNPEAFILAAQEEERKRQEEAARQEAIAAEIAAKQAEVAQLIGLGDQQKAEADQADAVAGARNMQRMVDTFTAKPAPPAPAPTQPDEYSLMEAAAPGELTADVAPEAVAEEIGAPLAAPLPEETPEEAVQGAKEAEAVQAQQTAIAAEEQKIAETMQGHVNYFTAAGANPAQAMALAEGMMELEKSVYGPLEAAANLNAQAGMIRGYAQTGRFAEETEARQEYQEWAKPALDDLMAKTKERLGKITEIDAKIEAGEIDPGRVWHDTSNMGKAFIGLGAGMYRLLQLKQGNIGGQNVVLNALDTAIERDIAAQKANMDLLLKQRGFQRQGLQDEVMLYGLQDAAMEKMKMNRISTAIAVMNQEIASGALPKEVAAKMLTDIAKLGASKDEARQAMLSNWSKVLAAQSKKIRGTGGPSKPGDGGIREVGLGTIIRSPSGKNLVKLSGDDKTFNREYIKGIDGTYKTLRKFNQLISLYDSIGSQYEGWGRGFFRTPEGRQVDSLYAGLIQQINRAENGARASDIDLAFTKERVPKNALTQANAVDGIRQARESILEDLESSLRTTAGLSPEEIALVLKEAREFGTEVAPAQEEDVRSTLDAAFDPAAPLSQDLGSAQYLLKKAKEEPRTWNNTSEATRFLRKGRAKVAVHFENPDAAGLRRFESLLDKIEKQLKENSTRPKKKESQEDRDRADAFETADPPIP